MKTETENKGREVTLNCVKSKGESVKKFKSNINFDDCFSVCNEKAKRVVLQTTEDTRNGDDRICE